MAEPRIAEKALTKTIVDVLLHGGGTPSQRAHVAAGLIQSKVVEAYGLPQKADAA